MSKINRYFNILSIILPIIGLSITENFVFLFAIFLLHVFTIFFNLSNTSYKIYNNHKFILCFVILIIISYLLCLTSIDILSSLKTTTIILGSSLLFLLVLMTNLNASQDIIKSFKFIIMFSAFLCIYGLVIRILGEQYIIDIDGSGNYIQRLSLGNITLSQSACGDKYFNFMVGSLTGNPNTLSYLSLFSIAMLSLCKIKFWKKMLLYIILIIGIFISGSRMALVSLILFGLYKIFLKIKSRKLLAFYIVLLLILAIILILNFQIIYKDILSIDLNGRNESWTYLIKTFPLIGSGLGNDILKLHDIGINSSTHNSYISLITNYGIFLSVIILFIMFLIILHTKKIKSNQLVNTCKALFILLLIAGISESVFLIYGWFNYLFLLVIFEMIRGDNNDNNIYTNV